MFITFQPASSTEETVGMAVFSLNGSKAEILHASALQTSEFSTICRQAANYVRNNSVVKEVVIRVKHSMNQTNSGQQKLAAPIFFKTALKEAGFKWKSMENKRNEERFTIYYFIGKNDQENFSRSEQRLTTGQIQVVKSCFKHTMLISEHEIDLKGAKRSKSFFKKMRRFLKQL